MVIIEIEQAGARTYHASVDGVRLCTSHQPFLDSARVLLQAGGDPSTRIVMRRKGSDVDCLISTIGAAAKLTVKERAFGGCRFELWERLERAVPLPGVRQDREILSDLGHPT